MRVAHVIPSVAARDGGPSSSVVSMCRALTAQGVDVTLVTTDADGKARLPVALNEPTDWKGVRTLFFRRQWTESFKYSGGLARWLGRHVTDFDVVHTHGVLSHAPLAAARACQRAGVPYIVRPLGTLDPWSLAQKARKKQLLLSFAKPLLRGAAAIHCTSDEERQAVEAELSVQSAVTIPLGVEETLIAAPPVTKRMSSVLVVSRLHPVKNLEAFIHAFGDAIEAAGNTPRWTLIIAGSGDDAYEQQLRQLVQDRRLETRVSFAGWVDRDAKVSLLRSASIFALPSFHENFGVSLVEALACGLPAFVTRQVHLSSMVATANAGWVVEVDRQSLRDGLLQAWRDLANGRALDGAARTLAQRFGWRRVAGELSALYTSITERSAVRTPAAGEFASDGWRTTGA